MPHDSNSNAPSSGRTSSRAAGTRLSESAYLAKQAADAKAAIARTLDETKRELGHTVDPSAWVHAHPWATLGGAAVAGFVAATALIPSKQQQALKRLAAIEAALTPKKEHDPSTNGHEKPPDAEHRFKSAVGHIAGTLFTTLRPLLMTAISARITANASQPGTSGAKPADAGSTTASHAPSTDPSI